MEMSPLCKPFPSAFVFLIPVRTSNETTLDAHVFTANDPHRAP